MRNQTEEQTIIELVKELFHELNEIPLSELYGFKNRWLKEIERIGNDPAVIEICGKIVDEVIQDKEANTQ